MVKDVMGPIRADYIQSWLLLLTVIRCYLAGAMVNNEGFRGGPRCLLFFAAHNSETSGG
jgi:hypothetical protein